MKQKLFPDLSCLALFLVLVIEKIKPQLGYKPIKFMGLLPHFSWVPRDKNHQSEGRCSGAAQTKFNCCFLFGFYSLLFFRRGWHFTGYLLVSFLLKDWFRLFRSGFWLYLQTPIFEQICVFTCLKKYEVTAVYMHCRLHIKKCADKDSKCFTFKIWNVRKRYENNQYYRHHFEPEK